MKSLKPPGSSAPSVPQPSTAHIAPQVQQHPTGTPNRPRTSRPPRIKKPRPVTPGPTGAKGAPGVKPLPKAPRTLSDESPHQTPVNPHEFPIYMVAVFQSPKGLQQFIDYGQHKLSQMAPVRIEQASLRSLRIWARMPDRHPDTPKYVHNHAGFVDFMRHVVGEYRGRITKVRDSTINNSYAMDEPPCCTSPATYRIQNPDPAVQARKRAYKRGMRFPDSVRKRRRRRGLARPMRGNVVSVFSMAHVTPPIGKPKVVGEVNGHDIIAYKFTVTKNLPGISSRQYQSSMLGGTGIRVNVSQGKTGNTIGIALFYIRPKVKVGDKTVLSPIKTWVDRRYHRQGLATAMYKYLKDEGYYVEPGDVQSRAGRALRENLRDRRIAADDPGMSLIAMDFDVPVVGSTLTKRQIAVAIADELNIAQARTRSVVAATLDKIALALLNGQRVELRNFGVFEMRRRKAKIAMDPRNQQAIYRAEERFYVHFKPSKKIHEPRPGVYPGRQFGLSSDAQYTRRALMNGQANATPYSSHPQSGVNGAGVTMLPMATPPYQEPSQKDERHAEMRLYFEGEDLADEASLWLRTNGVKVTRPFEHSHYMRAKGPRKVINQCVLKFKGSPCPGKDGGEFKLAYYFASVPMMVTRDMKQQLLDLGFKRSDIANMTPQRAWDELNRHGGSKLPDKPIKSLLATRLQEQPIPEYIQKIMRDAEAYTHAHLKNNEEAHRILARDVKIANSIRLALLAAGVGAVAYGAYVLVKKLTPTVKSIARKFGGKVESPQAASYEMDMGKAFEFVLSCAAPAHLSWLISKLSGFGCEVLSKSSHGVVKIRAHGQRGCEAVRRYASKIGASVETASLGYSMGLGPHEVIEFVMGNGLLIAAALAYLRSKGLSARKNGEKSILCKVAEKSDDVMGKVYQTMDRKFEASVRMVLPGTTFRKTNFLHDVLPRHHRGKLEKGEDVVHAVTKVAKRGERMARAVPGAVREAAKQGVRGFVPRTGKEAILAMTVTFATAAAAAGAYALIRKLGAQAKLVGDKIFARPKDETQQKQVEEIVDSAKGHIRAASFMAEETAMDWELRFATKALAKHAYYGISQQYGFKLGQQIYWNNTRLELKGVKHSDLGPIIAQYQTQQAGLVGYHSIRESHMMWQTHGAMPGHGEPVEFPGQQPLPHNEPKTVADAATQMVIDFGGILAASKAYEWMTKAGIFSMHHDERGRVYGTVKNTMMQFLTAIISAFRGKVISKKPVTIKPSDLNRFSRPFVLKPGSSAAKARAQSQMKSKGKGRGKKSKGASYDLALPFAAPVFWWVVKDVLPYAATIIAADMLASGVQAKINARGEVVAKGDPAKIEKIAKRRERKARVKKVQTAASLGYSALGKVGKGLYMITAFAANAYLLGKFVKEVHEASPGARVLPRSETRVLVIGSDPEIIEKIAAMNKGVAVRVVQREVPGDKDVKAAHDPTSVNPAANYVFNYSDALEFIGYVKSLWGDHVSMTAEKYTAQVLGKKHGKKEISALYDLLKEQSKRADQLNASGNKEAALQVRQQVMKLQGKIEAYEKEEDYKGREKYHVTVHCSDVRILHAIDSAAKKHKGRSLNTRGDWGRLDPTAKAHNPLPPSGKITAIYTFPRQRGLGFVQKCRSGRLNVHAEVREIPRTGKVVVKVSATDNESFQEARQWAVHRLGGHEVSTAEFMRGAEINET